MIPQTQAQQQLHQQIQQKRWEQLHADVVTQLGDKDFIAPKVQQIRDEQLYKYGGFASFEKYLQTISLTNSLLKPDASARNRRIALGYQGLLCCGYDPKAILNINISTMRKLMTHVDIEQPTSKWYPMIQKNYTVYLKAQALKDEEEITLSIEEEPQPVDQQQYQQQSPQQYPPQPQISYAHQPYPQQQQLYQPPVQQPQSSSARQSYQPHQQSPAPQHPRQQLYQHQAAQPPQYNQLPTLPTISALIPQLQRPLPPPVLLLGDPKLRELSAPIVNVHDRALLEEKQQLMLALDKFRSDNGFGRAISAPQIGVLKRFIALNLGSDPFCVINPVITHTSREKFTMWDDCMSFPWLMVKVERFKSISIKFTKEDGSQVVWQNIDQATSELLQHEIDHLDGVLALDRAIDRHAIISRATYDKMKDYFNQQVDYQIVPTIKK